jgi:hypothetical protein
MKMYTVTFHTMYKCDFLITIYDFSPYKINPAWNHFSFSGCEPSTIGFAFKRVYNLAVS